MLVLSNSGLIVWFMHKCLCVCVCVCVCVLFAWLSLFFCLPAQSQLRNITEVCAARFWLCDSVFIVQALAVAREARPCISPRAGMMEQLLTWEQVLSMRKVCHASPLHKDDVLLKVIPTN